MRFTQLTPLHIAIVAMTLATSCNRPPERLSPEEAKTRGDTLLRQMSQTLASMQVFSFTADEAVERVTRDGTKTENKFSRNIIVRRPNALAFADTAGRDRKGWYDGKQLTLVSSGEKVWARGPMPGTLDEALDYVAVEYDVKMPVADLLYASPYDALMTADTTGGWVGVESVDGTSCDHLSYSHPVVDWQVWLTQDEKKLPRQIQIKYKKNPGQPVTRAVLRDWNQAPQVTEATFTPSVPEGYERLKIMRHASVIDEKASEEKPKGTQGR
jgi:hypothetical protein